MKEKKYEKEDLKYIYDLVNSWIGNADNKVSVSCGIFTGVFGVITFLSEKITNYDSVNSCYETVYCISFVLSIIAFLLSIFFYVWAINPNLGKSGLKKNGKVSAKKYPIFYGDINNLSVDDYKKVMNRAEEHDLINELLLETHYNSHICYLKMIRYRCGLWLSFAAVVMSIVSWCFHLLMYV